MREHRIPNRATAPDGGVPLTTLGAPDAIELRHLRAFVAVAEELNFGRAAARLYLSQPALSRQIRALERLVGCALLRRSTHRVELTLAGEALLERSRRLLEDMDEAVSATRSVGGELEGRVARLWEPIIELTTGDAELQELRDSTEAMLARFPPPAETAVRPVNTGGVQGLLLTPAPDAPLRLLYLHGGGYVLGSAYGYRPLAGALAAAAGVGTLVADYRLAPEHAFPAALEDAVRAYLWMLDRGVPPEELALAGDSSGGGLVLSLLLSLKQQQLPLPGRAVLLSPSVDIGRTVLGPVDEDASIEHIRRWSAFYLGPYPADDPLVSPLTADLTGLPSLLVQVGTGEPHRDESQRLTDRARDQGVDVRLELYPTAAHVFHLFWSFLPEAADAMEQAGRFVRAAQPGTAVGVGDADSA